MSSPPQIPAASAVEPIAFRPERTAEGAGLATSLALMLALLAAMVAGLIYAKHRGWLRRWIVQAPLLSDGVPATTGSLVVLQRLRLSPRTTIFQIRNGEQTFLVVESSGNVTLERR